MLVLEFLTLIARIADAIPNITLARKRINLVSCLTLMLALRGRSSERRKQLRAASVNAQFRDLIPLITAPARIAAQRDATHHNERLAEPTYDD